MSDQNLPENILVQEKGLSKFDAIQKIPREVLWQANYDSVNTQQTYGFALKQFMGFLGISTTLQLRQVTQAHVIAFKKNLLAQGCKPRTVNNRLTTISSVFNDLIANQVVMVNPALGVRRLPVNYDRVEAKTMTPEQVRNMLNAPDLDKLMGKRDYAILSTLFFTGCRVSEVTTLQVKDFYEEDEYDMLDFWVKGGKRNRLAVHPELAAAIKEYLDCAGHSQDKDSFLFLPIRNAPASSDPQRKLSRRSIDYIFKKYARKLGLQDRTVHSARATFITQALENNCPIEHTQRSVGHAQLKTTQMYDKRVIKKRNSASFAVRY